MDDILKEVTKITVFARISQIALQVQVESTLEKCPPNTGNQCFNNKPYHAIVVQAVVDANLKFVTVDVGAYDKQSNGGAF